ncbi:hypothetical protein [Streptomyces sp. NPDC053560]|uniref:TetR/AcrR family transcriptional regulator n=1 Tax=Streptomyces sp. NPDC053560 TaxID=3365711 RepID=UPI0037D2F5AD
MGLTRDSDGSVRHFYSAHPRMSDDIDERGIDLLAPERLLYILKRADHRGLVPVLQVAVQHLAEPAAERAARTALHERLVEPLHRRFAAEGLERPRLRAEMIVAAIFGVALGRGSGAFDELGEVAPDDLGALLLDTLAAGA